MRHRRRMMATIQKFRSDRRLPAAKHRPGLDGLGLVA
jgi:hypothetical protein